MRIANLSPAMLGLPRIVPTSVMKTCEAVAREGHEVVLFAGRVPGCPEGVHAFYGCAETFAVVSVPIREWRGLDRFRYSARVLRRLRSAGPFDALWGRDVAAMAVAARDVPFVFETHSPPRTRTIARLQRAMVRRPSARGLAVEHGLLRRHYLDLYPWLGPDDVVVAYNGADPHDPPARTRRAWWPGRAGSMQAGYVGSLRDEKGISMLLEVADRIPNVDVHLVGGTDAEISRWRGRSGPNVIVHTAVPPAALREYYGAMDCLLAPPQAPVAYGRDTVHWQLPSKVFQYMAQGRAICASDTPVVSEVLEHDRSAVLLPPGDAGAWAAALTDLASNDEKRRALGEGAHAALVSAFTWGHRARRIIGMLEHVRSVA